MVIPPNPIIDNLSPVSPNSRFGIVGNVYPAPVFLCSINYASPCHVNSMGQLKQNDYGFGRGGVIAYVASP